MFCVPEAAEDGHGAAAGTWPAGLGTVLREWGRTGITGFGGPPAHIALLRRLSVDNRGWLDAAEFEDAIAACNLLPGPASAGPAAIGAIFGAAWCWYCWPRRRWG